MKFKYKMKDFVQETVRIMKECHVTISLVLGLNCLLIGLLSSDVFILFTGSVLTVVSAVDILFVDKEEGVEK